MVLDGAPVRGPCQDENPARWKGETLSPHRDKLALVVHRAALPYREVGAFG